MIDLALSPEEEQKRKQAIQMQQAPLAMGSAPQPQKGMAGQMSDMVKQKLMSDAAGAGATALTEGLKSAGTSALGGSAMTGISTAMPYVGAGLLAGKMFGLFNQGGQVGPLGTQYHAKGTKPDFLDLDKDENTTEPMEEAAKSAQYKAQGGMTEAAVRALMMNQPDPSQLYDEVMAESMTEAAQQVPTPMMRPPLSVDPFGADTTSNIYDMIRPDNAPNT